MAKTTITAGPPPDDQHLELEKLEHAYPSADLHERRRLVLRYLECLGYSVILQDLITALKMREAGKKSVLLDDEAPTQYLGHPFRRYFEGWAAALLEWAMEKRLGRQGKLAARLAKSLAEVGWHRLVWGNEAQNSLSSSTLIKWRYTCKAGKHPATQYFNDHLERLRGWGFVSADEAVEEFEDYLCRSIQLGSGRPKHRGSSSNE